MADNKMHPLVVFKEMYDQYRIDGVPIAGEKELLPFKNFFDIIQEKLNREKVIKKAGGGMMNMDEMIRPLGYAAGGPIPPEPEKTGMLSGLLSLIKDRLAPQQREDGGEEYMKIFNFLWDKGFDAQQIDDIINRRVNQEDLVPSRKNLEEKFKG
tara:strand:- start:54 stop:515 length:462 start_codon:yes stop_codon:yes gene_type:complete